ncbi:calmodulin [Maioricimonas sp. JC845]|uniref:BP74-related protein n=1 Tax=Maioricimonas sp. JC845 TaxID=3232138 RepID=UPI003459F6FA
MSHANAPAFFAMTDVDQGDPFIVRINHRDAIVHARRILTGKEKHRTHIRGAIVKQTADFNPGWSFHLHPDSIEFFELAMEVCDASIRYVEDHLDAVGGDTLPGGHWCPWSSRLVAEVTSAIQV